MKYLLLFMLFAFGPMLTAQQRPNQKTEKEQEIAQIRRKLVGTTYVYPSSIDIVTKYGSPETLPGTNNSIWYAYFPKGNFTMVMDKKTDKITAIRMGRQGG